MTISNLTEQQRKCMECRECCEWAHYPVTMLSVEIMNYYLLRGDAFYFDPGGAIVFYVHKPCKHLTPEGCGIYETRPDTCVKYMCEPKDKSVKEIKKQQCDLAMAKVAEANTNYFKLKASREMPVQALST